MRFVIWIIAFATLAWSAYWFVASAAISRSAEAWFDDRRAEGWAAEYSALDVGGFPYRFDTVLSDLELADPATGVLWTMPRFEVTALAYAPTHVLAIFPDAQTLASPFNTLSVTTEDMRASARLTGTSLALSETRAELAALTATSTQGWEIRLASALAAARAGDGANTYDIYFEATDLRPSDTLRLGLDPQGRLPDTFETLKLDATAVFDAPWDRFAIERARPQPTRFDLKDFDARWGQLELRAVGQLAIDARGTPDGQITIKATNWREIVSLGEATGVVPEGFVPAITSALEALASLSGPPNTIDVPLTFARGRLSLGPFPLGPAPRIRLR
ncbi:MAG: DUF2125 domain-containing protein [Pseudomonadota bacterium]